MSVQTIFQPPDFSGYLKKKGEKFKAYRKRWFELRSLQLYYFRAQNQKQRPTGVIQLQGAKIEDDTSKKFSFKISVPGITRVYELTADNETDKQNWMKELKNIIQKETNKESSNSSGASTNGSSPSSGNSEKNETPTTIYGKKVGVDDFDLVKVIGRGSFGKVMKVRKKDTGKIFAMKVLKKDMIIKENMVAHTKAEKAILEKMNHPNIVKLHYAFQTPDKLYLVLDFLSGGELFFHLKEETKFGIDKAKFYTAQIVLALGHLHSHDIIYRDLKPENIVLDKEGHACMTDFGLAKSVSGASPTYTFCGTPEYLAPEILKGTGHGKAVDWWSLGILLYEMIVGLPPFYSENMNEMYELILKQPLTFPNTVPPDAQSLLKGLLERDEHKRLGSGPTDAAEIKNHPFFSSIDFDKLYKRELKPPFIPDIKKDDTAYFDEEFKQEDAKHSIAEVVNADDDEFGDDFDHNADEAN